MRSVCMLALTAWLMGAAVSYAQSPADDAAAPPDPDTPTPGRIEGGQLPSLVGDLLRQVSDLRSTGRSRRPHERHSRHGRSDDAPTTSAADPAAQPDVGESPGIVEVPPPAPRDDVADPAVSPPPGAVPAPVSPIGAAPFSFRDRLLAKRLGRVAQLKQTAAESGDPARMQQAEYLEGMVLELHEQGLFNFAQKFLSTLQQPEAPAEAAPDAEIPEADLGEPAALPEIDLGEPESPPDLPPVE